MTVCCHRHEHPGRDAEGVRNGATCDGTAAQAEGCCRIGQETFLELFPLRRPRAGSGRLLVERHQSVSHSIVCRSGPHGSRCTLRARRAAAPMRVFDRDDDTGQRSLALPLATVLSHAIDVSHGG
jgi:hypothetical protein